MLVAARTDRLADEFDRCEATLVDSAKVLTCDQLAKVLQRWRHVAHDAVDRDPSGVEADDGAASPSSEIFLSQTMAGRYVLSGDLTAEDGAILAHGIEVATRSLFHRGARLSDGAELDPAQRRAAGLVETFKRGVTVEPDRAGAQPLVLATVDLGLLTRRAERQALRALDASLADLETRRIRARPSRTWCARQRGRVRPAGRRRGASAHRGTGLDTRQGALRAPRRTPTGVAPTRPTNRATLDPPSGCTRPVRPRRPRPRPRTRPDRSVRPRAVRDPRARTHPRRHCPPARLQWPRRPRRARGRPHHPRHGTRRPPRHPRATPSARRPRPRLRVPRLRPRTSVVRSPPPRLLRRRRRSDRPGQPCAGLQPPPPPRPRRPLGLRAHVDRLGRHEPHGPAPPSSHPEVSGTPQPIEAARTRSS